MVNLARHAAALGAAIVAGTGAMAVSGPLRADDVTVFAAASLTDAVADVAAAFEAETGHRVIVSSAGSSTLARQIEQGAPADIYISANQAWMDHLDDLGLLVPGSRTDLLANRLVLVAPAATAPPPAPGPEFDLAAALGDGRLAIGDPDHVPAGIYARQALEATGAWPAVAERLAPMSDVRQALALVARGEVPLGVVYATDAASVDDVVIVATFPAETHDPIVYPAALIAGQADGAAEAFLDFGRGAAAGGMFEGHGFIVLACP